jgi:hypothetical protein
MPRNCLACTLKEAQAVADHYRRINNKGDDAFLDPELRAVISQVLPALSPSLEGLSIPLGFTAAYDAFDDLDPAPYYNEDLELVSRVRDWRSRGKITTVVTDSMGFNIRSRKSTIFFRGF